MYLFVVYEAKVHWKMKVADVQQPNKEISGKEDNTRIVQAISREKKKNPCL